MKVAIVYHCIKLGENIARKAMELFGKDQAIPV